MNFIKFSLTSTKTSQIYDPIPVPKSEDVERISKNQSLCQRISNAYKDAIRKFVDFLQKHNCFVASMVIGTLLLEPWQAIRAGFACPTSWKKHFNFYNMNPKSLTREQLYKQPILLIHGNYHNQSAWLGLAKRLKHSHLGPVYTVNLPNGPVTDKDYEIVRSKIEQIKSQYKQSGIDNFKINLVGHSRGGYIAGQMSHSDDIGKIIKIGAVSLTLTNDRIYEITGKHDILETGKSILPSTHNEIINSGHLGLVNSSKTHGHIIRWLC